jgi:hypothetical protein
MKTTLTWLFWLAIIGGGVAWYFMHQHQTQVGEQRAIELGQRKDASIAALALKYSAVTNWTTTLVDRGVGGRPFSIEVTRALIRSNGQPVLIMMGLRDVAENNGGYTALFGEYGVANGSFQLSSELRCTQEQANQLLKTPDDSLFQRYAVVARFDKLVRPTFKVNGIGSGEDSSIELDDSSAVFLVKGELLEAIRLP